jgi:hypothetical protein
MIKLAAIFTGYCDVKDISEDTDIVFVCHKWMRENNDKLSTYHPYLLIVDSSFNICGRVHITDPTFIPNRILYFDNKCHIVGRVHDRRTHTNFPIPIERRCKNGFPEIKNTDPSNDIYRFTQIEQFLYRIPLSIMTVFHDSGYTVIAAALDLCKDVTGVILMFWLELIWADYAAYTEVCQQV